jgi:epsilon-lactone hydrolase
MRLPLIETVPPVQSDLPLVAELVREAHTRADQPVTDVAKLRAVNGDRLVAPLIRRPVHATLTNSVSNGVVRAEWISVPGGGPAVTFLYFHGGSYIRGSLLQGRGIASCLASLARGRTFAVDYGQAPERPFPGPILDGLDSYRYLLDHGVDPASIVLAGDSCGGALVVSVMVAIRATGLPIPCAGISISPWCDLSMSGESYAVNADKDLARLRSSSSAAKIYLAGADPTHPAASPIFADLSGLAPLLIVVGSNEILLSDATGLAETAARCNVDVSLYIFDGMPHVFPMFKLGTGDECMALAARFALDRVSGSGA